MATKYLNLGVALLILAGCNSQFEEKDDLKKVDVNVETTGEVDSDDTSPYQIGPTWGRDKISPHYYYPYQILKLNRTGMGDVGVGVYLGEFSGRHFAMTVGHIFPNLEPCDMEVSFLVEDQNEFQFYPCAGWHYALKDNDIFFFEISQEFASVKKLSPISISQKQSTDDLPLRLLTLERNSESDRMEWFLDDSDECRLLSKDSKLIDDPDTSDSNKLSSWSMAMGCDAKHGDSGAPVFDENFRLLGLLWTGKFPKDESSRQLVDSKSEKVWTNYNYLVPVHKITEELETILNDKKLSEEESASIALIHTLLKGQPKDQ